MIMDLGGELKAIGTKNECGSSIFADGLDIAQNAEESQLLRIVLCRFNSGIFERNTNLIDEVPYLAISHVWGKVEWRTVPGIQGEVIASKEKAQFIVEKLPGIVGEEYFWMDILCINQRDEDARVAITQHIPTIFRRAQENDCCSRSFGVSRLLSSGYGRFIHMVRHECVQGEI